MNTAKGRAAQYAIALDAANNSAILSRSQYRAGLTDFTTLNTAESQLLSARNGLTQAKADQATALIQLYLALGGGWDSTTVPTAPDTPATRSEEHTSELQSLMRISYAVFCLKQKQQKLTTHNSETTNNQLR